MEKVCVPWSSDRLRDNKGYYTTADEDYKNSTPFEMRRADKQDIRVGAR
jgi:hypothetical protein